MYKTQLCLGINESFALPAEEQIRLFAETGFEGFFSGWGPGEDLVNLRRTANETGMLYQSVHAPILKMKSMWFPDAMTPLALEDLLGCLHACADQQVPLMIVHAYIGFEKDTRPTAAGIDNYGKVVREAEKLGVKIAFENTEGEIFLEELMRCFPEAGFCWDTGHQMCYNPDTDMMALYGSRLVATHLNDNVGVRSFHGDLTWHDDLHLLPFDGIIDWPDFAAKIKHSGFNGPLTFELLNASKPNRHDNDLYAAMDIRDYIAQAYMRACRVAALVQRA